MMELTYGDDPCSIESSGDLRAFYRHHQKADKKLMKICVSLYEAAEPDETLIRMIQRIDPSAQREEVDEAPVVAQEIVHQIQQHAEVPIAPMPEPSAEWNFPAEMP